jgi:hypothetical protein
MYKTLSLRVYLKFFFTQRFEREALPSALPIIINSLPEQSSMNCTDPTRRDSLRMGMGGKVFSGTLPFM